MAFAAGSNHLDVVMGFVNTLVLIVSSLTMALTVYFAQKGNRNMQVILIMLTMFFGATFLGVKASSIQINTITDWFRSRAESNGKSVLQAARGCRGARNQAVLGEHRPRRAGVRKSERRISVARLLDLPKRPRMALSDASREDRIFVQRADRR